MTTVAISLLLCAPAAAQGVRLKTVIHHAGAGVPCRALVTAPLRFAYDPFSGAGGFSTAIVTLSCIRAQLLASVAISPGNANRFGGYREMWRNGTDGSHVLMYDVYTTNGYEAIWGDGTGGSSVQAVNRVVTTFEAVLFAKVQYPQADVMAGEYSDTITVTFNL